MQQCKTTVMVPTFVCFCFQSSFWNRKIVAFFQCTRVVAGAILSYALTSRVTSYITDNTKVVVSNVLEECVKCNKGVILQILS
ncbi:hypothetical protein GDO81_016042 [Engystomops pustulosus]|uniref:Secreted protein n=1 Tax=Engystomops pustulosus TaxID=76066 RepID=A0AAV7AQC0_ENGPU|nr:hypothetical protein GDO81_016042 [Engystomops pustulosus]